MTAKQSTFNGRTSTTAAAFDPHDHARLIAARACPVTPRMLASACAVGLGLGAMNAGAATFTVKSVGDSAPGATTCAAGCTLRDAIEVANLTTATDTIKFDPAIFPLTASTTILLDMAQPDIDITTSMIITGPGPGVITIDGDADDRIFDIDNPSDPTPLVVNISGLTLTNGSVAGDGGAIETDDAKLTISNCVFSSNAATGDGGAIDSDGFYSTLTVKDSVFTGNAATGDGGAIYVDDSSRVAARSLHISNSRFSGNTASKGGGLYIESLYSPGLIENSVIDGNTATGDGGGISLYSAVERGTVTIRNTTISNNTAGSDGGGVYLYSPYAQVLIDNSTISGNSAGNDGGGIFLYYTNNFVRVRNTTIADNSATFYGGGIYLYGSNAREDTLMLQNTIVADNSAGGAGPDLREDEGRFLAEFTMVGDTSGIGSTIQELPGGGNILDVDPNLFALQNNGGSSKTHALDFLSSPLDRGSNSICTASSGATTAALVRDQRGVFRPIDADADLVKTCDSGAYEFNGRTFGDCPSSPDLTSCQFDTGDANGFIAGTLIIKDNLTNNTLDSFALTLTKNSALIGQDFFGAPTTHDGTASTVCVYFGATLVAQYNAAAGELDSAGKVLWKQTASATAVTNSYTNSKGNADGLTALTQKSGAINAATITAAAKGLAAPDVTLPLAAATDVVVEVQTTDGKCVSTTISAAKITKNTNTELAGKLP